MPVAAEESREAQAQQQRDRKDREPRDPQEPLRARFVLQPYKGHRELGGPCQHPHSVVLR